LERGGLRVAAFSASVSERGRCTTQIWPCQSAVIPPICPRIQLLGSCFGQEASTAKVGASPAEAGWVGAPNDMAAMQREMVLANRVSARARFDVGVINASHDF